MKCKQCGNDLFPEQFKCEKCGRIVALDKEEPKNDKKDTKAKETKK